MFKYKMTQRPFGIGCQPKGWIDCINSNRGETGFHSIVIYDRELTAKEIASFELTPVEGNPVLFKEIPTGAIFTLDETTTYPKLKVATGYIDMRDRFEVAELARPQSVIRIMSKEEVAETFEGTVEDVDAWIADVLAKFN